jgi:hypothetical protein
MSEISFGHVSLSTLRRWCLVVAGAWGLICIFCWIFAAQQFYRSYLFAWFFWLGMSLGSLGIVMLHHLTGGEWGIVTRRFGEHAALCVGLMFMLFIPIAIGVPSLYDWAKPERLKVDAILRHEQPLLNWGFFVVRAVIYLTVWTAMAWYLRSASLRHDKDRDPAVARHAHDVSAMGMVVLFISMSLAALDWIMSRDSHWVSTVFGLVIICGQAVAGLCLMIVMLGVMAKREPFRGVLRPDQFNDLGNVLLTLVILWTYMSFAQLLVIWMGNRQDEITWYVARLSNGWWWIGLLLLLFHFFVPFCVLLMREAKRSPRLMPWFCAGLLVLRVLDIYWTVAPSGGEINPLLHHVLNWMDFVFPIGMGALWVAFFLWLMEGHPLIVEPAAVVNAELHDAES